MVQLDGGTEVNARTMLIATGARYRRLDVPGLERFEGDSVFYAATQLEAKVCRGHTVAVVGGGNSAGQATLFLAAHATVRLVVRGDDLDEHMSRYLAARILRTPSNEVLLHTEVRELLGDGALDGLTVRDTHTGERSQVDARALFVFIGAEPRTRWLDGRLALDDHGFVLTGAEAFAADEAGWRHTGRRPQVIETSRPGVFAAGDVRRGSIKRVAAAVREGSMAVRLVHDHLGHTH